MARMGIEAQGKQRGTKFITIVELERRQSKAKQQAKEKKVAKQASQKKAKAEQMAKIVHYHYDTRCVLNSFPVPGILHLRVRKKMSRNLCEKRTFARS